MITLQAQVRREINAPLQMLLSECCQTVWREVHLLHMWMELNTGASQTPDLCFRQPDRFGCLTDLHWLSRFSGSRSPHLEHATAARHLCLIIDCI